MNQKLSHRRILIVDDNQAIHADFRKILASNDAADELERLETALYGEQPQVSVEPFELLSAYQGQEALQLVRSAAAKGRPIAMAFVDMRMPTGWDGVETITHLWKEDPDLQVVICTAYGDYSWKEIIEQLGTTDRLLILKKPFDNIEACQLATALTEKWALTKQARMNVNNLEAIIAARTQELRRAASHDKLTDLPNRTFLNERLATCIRMHEANPQRGFSVHFLDFDRFKVINDSLGHEAGDQLLIAIADRLYHTLKEWHRRHQAASEPFLARLGGDEFVILLEDVQGVAKAVSLIDDILAAMATQFCILGHDVRCSVSIGVTSSDAKYTKGEDVLRDADTAMYRAKHLGGGRYVVFDRSMHEAALSRLKLESELRRALEWNQLHLCFQPIVNLQTGLLVGFESLLRWRHPEHDHVPPLTFIPLAEEIGLIVPIGEFVLRQAIGQLMTWRASVAAEELPYMAVNVSRVQLRYPGFVPFVQRLLSESQIDPRMLVLEITESAIMHDPEAAETVLRSLKALGVRIYMDDFGTGYSSLNCLHRFDLDGLKVDRSFIATVSERRNYTAIVNAIVALAHNLRMVLVAEGVETSPQMTMLQAMDCDQAQGYFFSKPIPPDQATHLLLQKRAVISSIVQARAA